MHRRVLLWPCSFKGSELNRPIISCCQLQSFVPQRRGLLLCTFGNESRQLHSPTVLPATIPSLFLPVKIVPTFPPLRSFILWRQTKTPFIWLCIFINDGKKKIKKVKKSHTLSSTQRTKILPWAIYHFLMTITKMNRTIRLNKNRHFFLLDRLHILQDCKSLSLEPSRSAIVRKARFQSLANFSSGYPKGPDTISILMMS